VIPNHKGLLGIAFTEIHLPSPCHRDSVLGSPMPRSISEPVELPLGPRPEATWGIQIHPN